MIAGHIAVSLPEGMTGIVAIAYGKSGGSSVRDTVTAIEIMTVTAIAAIGIEIVTVTMIETMIGIETVTAIGIMIVTGIMTVTAIAATAITITKIE